MISRIRSDASGAFDVSGWYIERQPLERRLDHFLLRLRVELQNLIGSLAARRLHLRLRHVLLRATAVRGHAGQLVRRDHLRCSCSTCSGGTPMRTLHLGHSTTICCESGTATSATTVSFRFDS